MHSIYLFQKKCVGIRSRRTCGTSSAAALRHTGVAQQLCRGFVHDRREAFHFLNPAATGGSFPCARAPRNGPVATQLDSASAMVDDAPNPPTLEEQLAAAQAELASLCAAEPAAADAAAG